MIGEQVGYGWSVGNADYDPDEQFQVLSRPRGYIKPYVERRDYDPPRENMRRQHLPLEDEYRVSFEERCYRMYRDYRAGVERGWYACSNEEYHRVYKYEKLYEMLAFGEYEVYDYDHLERVKIELCPENRQALIRCALTGEGRVELIRQEREHQEALYMRATSRRRSMYVSSEDFSVVLEPRDY